MLNHLSREITDIMPAIVAMFVMCVAILPFLLVATAVVLRRKERRNGRPGATVQLAEALPRTMR
ncbi:MAG TPA: hypothetical protein VGM17_18795 [Rhizomicrobium sp.]|jgi:hypothetical protein